MRMLCPPQGFGGHAVPSQRFFCSKLVLRLLWPLQCGGHCPLWAVTLCVFLNGRLSRPRHGASLCRRARAPPALSFSAGGTRFRSLLCRLVNVPLTASRRPTWRPTYPPCSRGCSIGSSCRSLPFIISAANSAHCHGAKAGLPFLP